MVVGLTFSKIGQQDLAIADFSLVLHLNPDHVNAAFGRAACYNTMGLFSQAIEDYNFALLKDQNNNVCMHMYVCTCLYAHVCMYVCSIV